MVSTAITAACSAASSPSFGSKTGSRVGAELILRSRAHEGTRVSVFIAVASVLAAVDDEWPPWTMIRTEDFFNLR